MLVLTRRIGEEIVIDHDIHIVVLEVKGDNVRLGICAPTSVRVDRQEIHTRRTANLGLESLATNILCLEVADGNAGRLQPS